MDEQLHELGVLFVRGIVEQERGQTLTIWADASANWLSGWLGMIRCVLASRTSQGTR